MRKKLLIMLLTAAVTVFTAACSGESEQTAETYSSTETAEASAETYEDTNITETTQTSDYDTLEPVGKMELKYAEMFTVDKLQNGLSLVTVVNEPDRFLVVPENTEIPENLPEDVQVIQQPVDNIYLAASALMDLFAEIDGLDSILATSTTEQDWSLPEIREKIKNEDILYAGKYSAPDFEMLLSENSSLAIESTMIYHSPEIKEQLEALGIPVMVERSSYESHPLGRMEWIKLCGLLIGKETEAAELFDQKIAQLEGIISDTNTEKTAAFFYVSSNGYVNVRKPGDYISKMMEMAGGRYVFSADDLNLDANDNALSTMNMQFETFYSKAKDADILIYNGTTAGNIDNIDQLIQKNKLFADFKAVKNGNVWCTSDNFYQQTSAAADVIADFYAIFNETGETLNYLYKLE